MNLNIFKSQSVGNFHLKDMSTYESKELKQAQSLENIQVQIHQLSGKLDDSLRQYEIGEVNKNYQQIP